MDPFVVQPVHLVCVLWSAYVLGVHVIQCPKHDEHYISNHKAKFKENVPKSGHRFEPSEHMAQGVYGAHYLEYVGQEKGNKMYSS